MGHLCACAATAAKQLRTDSLESRGARKRLRAYLRTSPFVQTQPESTRLYTYARDAHIRRGSIVINTHCSYTHRVYVSLSLSLYLSLYLHQSESPEGYTSYSYVSVFYNKVESRVPARSSRALCIMSCRDAGWWSTTPLEGKKIDLGSFKPRRGEKLRAAPRKKGISCCV